MPDGVSIADILIVLVLLVSTVFGVLRGLLKEVVSLAIWGAAVLLGLAFGETVATKIGLDDMLPRVANGIGFASVVVLVLVVGALFQRLLKALVQATGLSGTDRTLGLIFGALRGVVLAVFGLVALRTFGGEEGWWTDSRLAEHLLVWEDDVLATAGYIADLFGARTQALAAQLGAL